MMTTRRYQAETMADAIAQVKRDLGRDAMIVETRRRRIGGWLGLGGRRGWEVSATGQDAESPPRSMGTYVSEAGAGDEPPQAMPHRDDAVVRKLQEVRDMVAQLAGRPGGSHRPPVLQAAYEHLTAQEVEGPLAAELVDELARDLPGAQLEDASVVGDALRSRIAGRIRTAGRGGGATRSVIAFVGPTGVGKTTTIAKLAADLKINGRKQVALVTIDTYRIAAVDQLKTYADIIEVPVQAVLSPGELRQELARLESADVVLVDTTGRSPSDAARLEQLKAFLDAAGADEVHLVVSASSGQAAARKIVERFTPVGINRVSITKLDEASSFGVVLNVAAATGLPLSYTTFGQEVPDDICSARAEQLADMIVGEFQT